MIKLESGRYGTLGLAFVASWLVATAAPQDALAKQKKSNQDNAPNQTSMELFPVKRGYDGAQFIVTKAGYMVSLPGVGIAPDATQIAAYKDAQNNIWYIDRNGSAVKLTDEQVQWGMAQINQQAQARQMMAEQQNQAQSQNQAPQPPTANVVVVQQPVASSGGGGTTPLVTGLAAAGGAMAGATLSNSMYRNNYHGCPYGTPIYHSGGRPYYNGASGNKVYVNNSNNQYLKQFNQQTNWQNAQHNRHGQYPASQQLARNGNYAAKIQAHGGANVGRIQHNRSFSGRSSHHSISTARVSRGGARGAGRRR